jgi:hypothetical protein
MATEAPPPNKMKIPNAINVWRSGSAEVLAAVVVGAAVVAALPGDASGITKHGSVDIILPCILGLVVWIFLR